MYLRNCDCVTYERTDPFMKTILLVEDNDDVREAVAELLRDEGYDVREAEHGGVALEQLAQMETEPCLVLLDLMMPVMSGPELLRVLSETNRLASLRVVVLSAGGKAGDAPEAKKFLRKPVEPSVLLAVVREFCGDCSSQG
ncbi:MAG: glnG5 [Myxococcaceae bacterium]|nr:glnG5 [Myxococcaceae bacterium]